MRDSTKILLLGGIAILFACLFIGIGLTADNYQYFLSRRVPKVLAIVLAGVAIAQSSLVFQTITHNRILTPSIMGFDALYVLTQILIVLIFGGLSTLVLNLYVNFAIAVIVMVSFSLLLFGFYFSKGSKNLITLLLVGLIFGQLFSNAASFFSLLMDPNTYAIVQSKLYVSFNNVKVNLVYFSAPALMFACWLLFRMHRTLDVFWLDQDNAKSLGVDVPKVTRNVFIISAVLIAISTALVGPIMFFGLLVTNLSREMFRSYQHKTLLVGCSFLSISSLLAGQWIIENVFSFETTLSVVINFIGGAYFLYLLLKNKVV
ncbi:iron chelate uptake ABC transporter permease subunit VctG [Vibrio alginolyticus]